MRTSAYRLFRLCILALHAHLCFTAAAQTGDPMIRLHAPEIGKDSLVVTKENSVTITGKVFAGTQVMNVSIGNGATGQRIKADLQGDWGDFTARVELAAGENKLMVMTADTENRMASLIFRVRCEGSGALPRKVTEAKPVIVDDPPVLVRTPPQKEPVKQEEQEAKTVPPTRVGKDEVFTRDEVLGGKSAGSRATDSKVYAVVVGVSRYESDPALDLRYAARDAQAFGDHLLAANGLAVPRNNVTFLMNGEATAEALRYALSTAAARAGENDLLLFYFAGHGINDGSGRLCLLPYDVSTSTDQSRWATGLTQSVLLDALNSSRSKHRLVILDACQSGLLADGNAGVDGRSLAANDKALCVLTATGAGELAHESDRLDKGHGVFSYALLRGLQGAADGAGDEAKDGRITLAEAYGYVRREVPALVADLGGGTQRPMLHGTESVSIVLGRSGGSTRVDPVGSGSEEEKTGTGVSEHEPPVDNDPRFIPTPLPKEEVDGVVFADVETGEKVRFFNSQPTWSDVSGIVNGVIFHDRAALKGKRFEFDHQDEKGVNRKWLLEMSSDWSEVWVSYPNGDGPPTARTLRRIDVPKREELVKGTLFVDPVQDQRLEVVEQHKSWMRLTGNLGTRIVDLVAGMHGDVYDLAEDVPGWKAKGRMVMSDRWDGLSGTITFEDDKEVPFTLRIQKPTEEKLLEKVTYRDVLAPEYEVTFYNEREGSVEFNGKMRPGAVEVGCYKRGNVLLCEDRTGQMESFRLLLKNDRKKLLGTIVLKTERGMFKVDMNRVGNETAR